MDNEEEYVDYTECDRSEAGHAWYKCDDPGGWKPERKYFARRTHLCHRCGTVRYRGLNAWGQVESVWYQYPDDWKDRWGVGNTRPTGDEIRLMRVNKEREMRQ